MFLDEAIERLLRRGFLMVKTAGSTAEPQIRWVISSSRGGLLALMALDLLRP
jgi:hypothetical protein